MTEPIVVSYSELDTYRQCPLKWHLGWQLRYSKPTDGTTARDKGTLWHQVLEAHYGGIRRAQQEFGYDGAWQEAAGLYAHAAVFPILYTESGSIRSEVHDLIAWMYEGHLQHYGLDPDWEIIDVEVKDVVPLLWRGRETPFALKTKIDLIVRDWSFGGQLWVVDHKSGKDLPSNKALDIDDQFGLYTLAVARSRRIKVFGQVYNAARTQRNKTGVQTLESRMARERLYRDPKELAVLEEDVVKQLFDMYRHSFIDGEPWSSPNPETCKWKCDFLEVHLQARKQGRPAAEVAEQFGFEQDFTRH